MVKKFSTRYTNNDELSRMITEMKIARKSSGYNQDYFGKLIGISRETVVHIEGLAERTVLSLECEALKRWYFACANRISEYERKNLQNAITEYIFSSVFYPGNSHNDSSDCCEVTQTNQKTQQQKVA